MTDKTYIIERKNGSLYKITIPDDWKITFGPLIPGERGGSGTLALRIYEGKERQRAIFTDVKAFRDEGIPILEKVTKTKQQRMRKQTPEGAKDVFVEARISEWRDPDDTHDPGDEFASLPSPIEDDASF